MCLRHLPLKPGPVVATPKKLITAHLHRRRRHSGRWSCRGGAATRDARLRLEVFDDVALDSYVGTRRDRRPVLVLLLVLL